LQTSNLILDFEFDQHLESHKHVISIIIGFRDTGCYSRRCFPRALEVAAGLGPHLPQCGCTSCKESANSRRNQNLFEIRIDLDSSYHTENIQNVTCRCTQERKMTIN
jgi:hypothetical protein